MRWIGQHIWDLISRFRGDVYLEKVASDNVEGSPDNDSVLALKSGKIVRTAGGGGGGIKKVDDDTAPSSVADFDGKDFYLARRPNNSTTQQRLFVINNQQDGIYYEDLTRWVALTFNISTPVFTGQTNVNGQYQIGPSTSIWLNNNAGIDCSYNSIHSNGLDSGATNSISILNKSSSQSFGSVTTLSNSDIDDAGGNFVGLVDYRFGQTLANFDIYYPNDTTWQNDLGYKNLSIQVIANDQSSAGQQNKNGTYKFYNRKFYGFFANSTITGAQIAALPSNAFATNKASIGIGETSITPGSMKYIYYCYPSRYGDGQAGNTTNTDRPGTGSSCVLSWKINTLPVTGGFDHLTPSINVTGADYNNGTTITHTSISGVTAGMAVFGDGIPENATVNSVTSNTEFELSVSTTGGNKTNQNIFVGSKIAVTNSTGYTEFYDAYRSPQQYDVETSFEVIQS